MGIFSKLFRRSQEEHPVRYFHGGAPGIGVGQVILPRKAMPAWRSVRLVYNGVSAEQLGDHGETVSITTEFAIAEAYAGEYRTPADKRVPGQVYEVDPLSVTEQDPDFEWSYPTIARVRQGARVVALIGEPVQVQLNERYIKRAIGSHFRHPDGTPLYNACGYIRMTSAWREYGKTRRSLRNLGPWVPGHLVPEGPAVPADLPPLIK